MSNINLYDKFFHSPNWSYHNRFQLNEFRTILQSGYILSPTKLGKEPFFPELSEADKVYLSVHPNGEFAKEYIGKHSRNEADYSNGYGMTLRGQNFILSSDLKNDYNPERGEYDCECVVPNQVELYKYLVGIGNAGYSINDDFVLCYHLIRYFNDEINDDELVKFIKDSTFYSSISGRVWCTINYYFNPRQNYLMKQMHNSPESFVEVGNYYNVLMILEELRKNIPLYDRYGNIIVPQKSIEEAKKIHKYIQTNLDFATRDKIFDSMEELSERLEKV